MRNRNWRQYNKSLVQRGSLTFLIDPKIIKASQKRTKKKMGRPTEFSDEIIYILMLTKIHYGLSYRALEGFARDILIRLYPWMKVPTYSLICKRMTKLGKTLPKLSNAKPQTVIFDASGIRVFGEGEWKVKIHGRGKRRKWVKMHIGIDPRTQEVVTEITTHSNIADGSMTKELLRRSGRQVRTVIADGAYDGRSSRDEIKEQKAQALIPPPKNARVWGKDVERDDAIRIIAGLGGDKGAKSLWGKLTGYSARALVETAFSRFKRIFGDRVFSKVFDRQRVEISLKWSLLNRMRHGVI